MGSRGSMGSPSRSIAPRTLRFTRIPREGPITVYIHSFYGPVLHSSTSRLYL